MTTDGQVGGKPPADRQRLVRWPIVTGIVPQLVVGYIDRPDSGLSLPDALGPGESIVLADADDGLSQALGGMGGTGKTQLAIAAAQALRSARAIELLVWVPAHSRDAIVTGYAEALGQVSPAERGLEPELAAARLVTWLAGAGRPWLMVLDQLAEPGDLDGLWPRGPAGRTLVTTRRLDASLAQAGQRIGRVGAFTRREALTYLRARLDREQRLQALDLADDLGCLPIALSHAVAMITSRQLGCGEYRIQLADRMRRLTGSAATGYPAIVVASWWLALDAADRLPPAGLARPALQLAALLGPNGIPAAAFTSQAAMGLITGQAAAGADDEIRVRHALHNLARLGLLSIDADAPARSVRVHSLVQAAVNDSMSADELAGAAGAAASALMEIWPERDAEHPALAQALRDCVSSLQAGAGKLLWTPEAHPVLMRAGESMDSARMVGPAIAYWRAMTEAGTKMLGPGDPHTLRLTDKLGAASLAAGRCDDAIEITKRTLAERERVHGPSHADSLASCVRLADAYQAAGRLEEAIPLYERTTAEQAWLLGPAHPETCATRAGLARAYQAAGRASDAIPLYERIVAETELIRGVDDPDVLAVRRGLALAYLAAGRLKEAIRAHERAVADTERAKGPDHSETVAARVALAEAYVRAGRVKDAIRHSRRNLADRERVLGPSHPETLASRASLADVYLLAGNLRDAIALHESTLAERERIGGPGHPDAVTSRASLASAYHSAGRLADAIPLYKRAIGECDALHGPGHTDTITLRGNLAHAYASAGRPAEAAALLERTLADCERFLAPDHPLTQTMRENHDAITST